MSVCAWLWFDDENVGHVAVHDDLVCAVELIGLAVQHKELGLVLHRLDALHHLLVVLVPNVRAVHLRRRSG